MSYQSKFNSVMSSTTSTGFDMDFSSCEVVSSEENNAGPLTKAQKDLVEQIRSAGGVLRNSNAVDARTLNALVKKGVVSGSKDGFVLVDVSADADEIDTRFDGKTFDTESSCSCGQDPRWLGLARSFCESYWCKQANSC